MLSGRTGRSVAFALAAAALYALSTPFSKVLLADVAPNMMAALLYLGAGAGMTALSLASGVRGGAGEVRGRPLERTDAPYVAAMVALDVAAPLLLMAGLSLSSAESVSLLNNFEIVATALIARRGAGRGSCGSRYWRHLPSMCPLVLGRRGVGVLRRLASHACSMSVLGHREQLHE